MPVADAARLAASLPLPYMSAYVLGRGLSHAESFEVVAVPNGDVHGLYDIVLREVEAPLFAEVLRHCGGNQTRTAAENGARVITHCSAADATGDGATLVDELTGESFHLPARAVVICYLVRPVA